MSPPTCRAIVIRDGKLVEDTIALPPLEDDKVLVKINAAAFNPTDRLAIDVNAFGNGATGDRIGALIWGGEIAGLGAYSSYCIADEKISYHIPNGISFPAAATLPLAINTAWLALFSSDCLHLSRTCLEATLLVWGGSTAVGSYAIELAKHFGIDVIATCSPANADSVRKLGASQVFDYRDPDITSYIRETHPNITHVFDTVGNATSSATASSCIAASKGKLCTVRPGKANTSHIAKNVEVSDVFVFTAFLKEHSYRNAAFWPANYYQMHPENHTLSAELYSLLPNLLASGIIHPRPVQSLGKLSVESVEKAMDLNRQGKVSNAKLCFDI
ncbi:hypothetical protein BKA67DRAFT_526993 [Truncatella angustata]|uniref:Enoyl reductase (ER) domain-containing protein n=1 Tax=Truncatella angustata TaxID=152316 RepID=A0A9P8RJZ8_9PEZI|nr:uncharacterized protein BKA67DRAFT_526993 [Truncatella angustata]KAH6645688.1 hypothetical protein BKA67DRAFT_526993 [Truncatella angustata]